MVHPLINNLYMFLSSKQNIFLQKIKVLDIVTD